MLAEIKQGMDLECLGCKNTIHLTDETMFMNWQGEYIRCPHCGQAYDVQVYHINGKVAENNESEG